MDLDMDKLSSRDDLAFNVFDGLAEIPKSFHNCVLIVEKGAPLLTVLFNPHADIEPPRCISGGN
jgi:hypothetical protein